MSNVYYNPEDYGLKIVSQIDYSDGNYVFDTRVVWVEPATGNFYTARDSGCSCPVPFEDYSKTGNSYTTALDKLTDWTQLREEVFGEGDKYYMGNCSSAEDRIIFISEVRNAMIDSRKRLSTKTLDPSTRKPNK